MTTRARRLAAAAAAFVVLAALGACIGAPVGTVEDSHLTYDRTFDAALGAIADQRVDTVQQSRQHGTISGTKGTIVVDATLETTKYSTTRVTFRTRDDSPEAKALLKRVVDAYNERIRQMLNVLPESFKS